MTADFENANQLFLKMINIPVGSISTKTNHLICSLSLLKIMVFYAKLGL